MLKPRLAFQGYKESRDWDGDKIVFGGDAMQPKLDKFKRRLGSKGNMGDASQAMARDALDRLGRAEMSPEEADETYP